MGKMKNNLILKTALTACLFAVCSVRAEDMFINCASPNANPAQCGALYNDQAFLPTGGVNSAVAVSANHDVMVNGTPNAEYSVPGQGYSVPSQQVVFRDTAAPISVSQPMDDMEELGSEYAFYKTNDGGLIVESDVTQEEMGDGSGSVRKTRRTETSVSPAYVEMPSISAHQLVAQKKFGDSVHDWEANSNDSLRTLLIEWGQKSGWTVVWKLDRDYILEAGVVFRGTFTEVASAIIRTFARANPAPIGTFYKGNRVLVINTQEDDNA